MAVKMAIPERAAKLLRGVEQCCREAGLVRRDAGIGRGRGADEHRSKAEGHDDQAGKQVAGIRAVDRHPGEVVDACRRHQSPDD